MDSGRRELVAGFGLTWQIPTVISPSMAKDSFLVGAFAQCTILFAREVLNIQMRSRTRTISSEISFALRSGLALPVPAGVLEGALPATAAATQAANDPKKQKSSFR